MTWKTIGLSLLFWVVMTALVGFAYPAVMTGISQLTFPWRANGSLLADNGKLVGSELFGQQFDDPKYFWGRPSATGPVPYAGQLSAASNKTPAGDELERGGVIRAVFERGWDGAAAHDARGLFGLLVGHEGR